MTTKTEKASYTPGPWVLRIHREGNFPLFCIHKHRPMSAIGEPVVATVKGDNDEQANANARLIATVPELLEVCKELEMRLSLARMADQGSVDTMPVPLFLKKAREVIAKAEGKV